MDLELVSFSSLGDGCYLVTVDEYTTEKVGWFGPRVRRPVRRLECMTVPGTQYWMHNGRVIPLGSDASVRLWEIAMAWLAEKKLDKYIASTGVT